MFHEAVNLLLGVLALGVVSTFGTNQHLICKTVHDVFSDGSSGSRTQVTPRVLHGPPGKRGQTGVKGEPGSAGLKGEKGNPGFVDPQNVENAVEEKCREAIGQLGARIEKLEQRMEEMNSTVSDVADQPRCEEGFRYRQKCYFSILHRRNDINGRSAASDLCRGRGGALADILNLEHEELLEDHIRSHPNMTTGHNQWLGMSYTPSTSTTRWSTGVKVPENVAASMRWWPGYPRSSSDKRSILFAVDSNKFGIFNHDSTLTTRGVVCER